MYFAAGLFLTTGLLGVTVSLLTAPPRDYMVSLTLPASSQPRIAQLVRTTFRTRLDQRERRDEQDVIQHTELLPLAEKGDDETDMKCSTADESRSNCWKLCNFILGLKDDEDVEKKQEMEMEAHIQKLSSLEQSTLQKVILYSNLVIIIGLAIFLYIYMSINPFSDEELKAFEMIAFNKTHLKSNH